jgi:hypothetical protein
MQKELEWQMQQCRFCLSEDEDSNLLAPCLCKGSFKYVHSDCLIQWYMVEPTRGLNCSVCKEALSIEYKNPVETIPQSPFFRYLYEQNAVLLVVLYHMGYVIGLPIIIHFPKLFIYRQYYIFQCFLHIFYIYFFSLLLYHVKAKKRYFSYWKHARLILLVIHNILYFQIPSFFIFAGIASNVFLHMIVKEHFHILREMNGKKEFRFVNRN